MDKFWNINTMEQQWKLKKQSYMQNMNFKTKEFF